MRCAFLNVGVVTDSLPTGPLQWMVEIRVVGIRYELQDRVLAGGEVISGPGNNRVSPSKTHRVEMKIRSGVGPEIVQWSKVWWS